MVTMRFMVCAYLDFSLGPSEQLDLCAVGGVSVCNNIYPV